MTAAGALVPQWRSFSAPVPGRRCGMRSPITTMRHVGSATASTESPREAVVSTGSVASTYRSPRFSRRTWLVLPGSLALQYAVDGTDLVSPVSKWPRTWSQPAGGDGLG